ncbi:MAG: GntR family transcriptional regulator [Rhizobacter sp.]|nr:GntR family transcriptional regulator [Rhizobacter sp.]
MDSILARQGPAPTGGSLQNRIRAAVEEQILTGAWPPGSAIDEKALAAQFKASRTPVREALLVLATQGLVHIAPRSGIYVRKPTPAELVATLEALSELESVVASLAARRASRAHCEALDAALAKASACAQANDRAGYTRANAALHEVIYRASGNPVLVEQARSVRRTLAAYRQRSMDKPGRLKASDREHHAIVQAIREGDAAGAARAMHQHIDLGGDAMVQLVLAAQSTDAAPASAPGPALKTAPRRRASAR